MTVAQFIEGDPVRITAGTYKGAEGVVEDLQPECSAVRVHTKTGTVYGLLGMMEKIVTPVRMPKGNLLRR
jgi:ribosomal protein L24